MGVQPFKMDRGGGGIGEMSFFVWVQPVLLLMKKCALCRHIRHTIVPTIFAVCFLRKDIFFYSANVKMKTKG